jgi:hypothetical protein
VPEFVWAIVAKGEAGSIKKERWDLVSSTSLFFSSSCIAADGAVFSNAMIITKTPDVHKNDGESATPS